MSIVTFYEGAEPTDDLNWAIAELLEQTGEADRYTYKSAVIVSGDSGYENALGERYAKEMTEGDRYKHTLWLMYKGRTYYINFLVVPF